MEHNVSSSLFIIAFSWWFEEVVITNVFLAMNSHNSVNELQHIHNIVNINWNYTLTSLKKSSKSKLEGPLSTKSIIKYLSSCDLRKFVARPTCRPVTCCYKKNTCVFMTWSFSFSNQFDTLIATLITLIYITNSFHSYSAHDFLNTIGNT